MKKESSDYEKKVSRFRVRENEKGKESEYIRGEKKTKKRKVLVKMNLMSKKNKIKVMNFREPGEFLC